MYKKEWDIIIVGAGIMGLASAYYIKRNNPEKTVLVIEKDRIYSQGNSGRSVAGFRDFFSTEVNMKLARSSIKFYDHIQKDLNYDIDMKYVGYLFLMSSRKFNSMYNILKKLQETTKIKILKKEDLQSLIFLNIKLDNKEKSTLSLEPIEIGVLGKNCGILDIDKLSSFYYEQCRSIGVEFIFNTEITDIGISPINRIDFPGEPFLWQKKKVTHVSSNDTEFSADLFVFTMGAWTNKLLDKVGVDSHMRPKKRYVYQISSSYIEEMLHKSYGINDESIFPFTIFPSHGIYVRPYPKNNTFWVSTSGTTSDQEVGPTFSYDSSNSIEYIDPPDDYFIYNILPILRAYMKISDVKITGKWTGYYSLNTQDKTPYIFKFLNCIVATGGSGAGLMKSDSIGRIVSSILSGRNYTVLFDNSRIKNSALGVNERNVGIETLRF